MWKAKKKSAGKGPVCIKEALSASKSYSRLESLICLSLTTAFFLIVGIVILVYETKIVSLEMKLGNECEKGKCELPFEVDKEIPAGSFVFYTIEGVVQASQAYRESHVEKQLNGNFLESEHLDQCNPAKENSFILAKSFESGELLPSKEPLTPCGIKAVSFPNEKFEIYSLKDENVSIPILSQGIAWEEDKRLYKNTKELDKQWLNMTNGK